MRSSKTRKNILKPKYSLVLKTKSKLWFNPNKIRKLKKKRKWRATYFPLKFTHYKRNSFTLGQKKIRKSLLQYYNTNINGLPNIYQKCNSLLKNIDNALSKNSNIFNSNLQENNVLNHLLNNFKKNFLTLEFQNKNEQKIRSSFTYIYHKIRKMFFDQFNCFNNSKANEDFKYFLKKYLKSFETLNQYKIFTKNYYDFKRYFLDKKFLILNRSSQLNFFVKAKNEHDIHTIHGKYSSIFLNDFKMNLYKLKTFKLFYGMINKKSIKRLLEKSYVKGKRAKLQLFLTKFFELKLDVLIYRLQWSKSTLNSRFIIKRNDILVNGVKTSFKKTFLNPGDTIKVTKDKNCVMYQHLYSSFSNYTKIHPKYKSTPREYVTLWHLFLGNLRNKNKMVIGRFPKQLRNASLWNNFKYNVTKIPELRRSFAHNFKISKIDTKKPFFFVSQRLKEFNKIFNQRIFRTLNSYLKLKKLPKSSILKTFKHTVNFIEKKSNFKLNLFFLNFNKTQRPFSYIKHMSNYRQRMIFFNFIKKNQKNSFENDLASQEEKNVISEFLLGNLNQQAFKPNHNLDTENEGELFDFNNTNLENSLIFKLHQNYQKLLTEKNRRTGICINGGLVFNLENIEKNLIFGGFHKFFLNNILSSRKNAIFLRNLKHYSKNKVQDPEDLYKDTKMREVKFKNTFFRVGFNQIIRVKWRNYLEPRNQLVFVENSRMLVKKNCFLNLQKQFFDKKEIFFVKNFFNRLKKNYSLRLIDFLDANLHNYLKNTPELTPEIGLLFAQALEDRLDGKIPHAPSLDNISKVAKKIRVKKQKTEKDLVILKSKRGPRISRTKIRQHLLLDVRRACLNYTDEDQKILEITKSLASSNNNTEGKDKDSFFSSETYMRVNENIDLGELQKILKNQLKNHNTLLKPASNFKNFITLSYTSLLLNDLNLSYQINNLKSLKDEGNYLRNLFNNKLMKNRAKLFKYKKTCVSLLNPSYLEASNNLAIIAEYPNPQKNFSEYNSFFLNKNNLFLLLK